MKEHVIKLYSAKVTLLIGRMFKVIHPIENSLYYADCVAGLCGTIQLHAYTFTAK